MLAEFLAKLVERGAVVAVLIFFYVIFVECGVRAVNA